MALQKQILPLLVGGAMSEKLDPKTMPGDQLVSITDAYRAKSGELRGRTGWARMANVTDSADALASCRTLFPVQGGNLGLIGSLAIPNTADALYVYSKTENEWMHNYRGYQPMPMAVTSMAPVESRNIGTSTAASDLVNPDIAIASNVAMNVFTDRGAAAGGAVSYTLTDMQTGVALRGLSPTGFTGRVSRVAAGGSSYLVVFVGDEGAPGTIRALVVTVSTMVPNSYVVAAALVSGASPGFDVKSRPGSNNIIVSFAAAAGGTTMIEFNPATGAIVTGPTNIAAAAADVQMTLLEDQLATGSYYLATCGAATGIVLRKLSTAFAVTATNVVDAGAVVISTLTGHLDSATTYALLWNVSGAVRRGSGTVGGVATVVPWVRNSILNSRTFQVSSKWYVLANNIVQSNSQPTAYIISADINRQDIAGIRVAGIVAPANAGGTAAYGNVSGQVTSAPLYGSSVIYSIAKTTKFFPSGTTLHSIERATTTFTPKLRNARELSGTIFLPGGMVTQFDGVEADIATFVTFPLAVTGTTAVGGSMTPGGVYQYVGVFKKLDASGRVIRSAPSIPNPITLGAGDHSTVLQVPTYRVGPLIGVTEPSIEIYRAGPAAAGGIVYNKVGEVASDMTVDTVAFTDTMSDTSAALGELLYDPLANSGVLNNFPSPSTQLLEVLDNRVFVVSAENPTELWPSKEYKTGAGLAFNPGLVQRFTGSPITALAPMDGRLVVFQGANTWVWPIGPGPNDQGQGSFGDPQLVSTNIGCIDPNSVVATPDGIMFQAAQGIYLLTRGLDMQYIGAAVEDGVTTAMTVGSGFAGASLAGALNQVRFIGNGSLAPGASTKTVVYDYFFKQWYEWGLPANSLAIAAAATAGGVSYYVDSSGQVWQETANAFDETNSAAVPWSFKLAYLAVGQLGGWFMNYALQIIGSYQGPHVLTILSGINYGGASDLATLSVPSAPVSYQFQRKLARQKEAAIQPLIQVTPTAQSEGARISALSLIYGSKGGAFPLPANRRLT